MTEYLLHIAIVYIAIAARLYVIVGTCFVLIEIFICSLYTMHIHTPLPLQ